MKKKFRQHAREVISRISPQQAALQSAAAAAAVVSLPEFQRARSVFLYLPMPEEIDTAAIAHAAWADDKVVLLPRCRMSDRAMDACPVFSFRDDMTPSDYGIPEPHSKPWDAGQVDFVVVPGLAFDRAGGRLGRGAGFYDRFLERLGDHAVTCGLAFHQQVIEHVPMFDHDARLDILVTDVETLRF